MSVVYGIVKSHDGYIHVESTPDIGTTVDLYFPATNQTEQAVKRPAPSWQGGSETILVVDDENSIVSMFTHVLSKVGLLGTVDSVRARGSAPVQGKQR